MSSHDVKLLFDPNVRIGVIHELSPLRLTFSEPSWVPMRKHRGQVVSETRTAGETGVY